MCCTGGGAQVRQQTVKRDKPEKHVLVQRIGRSEKQSVDHSSSIRRQLLVKDDRCSVCGSPIMLVNISGRERKQCTNCRLVQ